MSSDSSIRFQNVNRTFVNRTFGAASIFASLNLEIQSGEFTAIVGPSGCGKSTLLKLAAQLDSPDGGQVAVSDVAKGFVFQDATLLPWRTVVENVALPLELAGMEKGARESKARESLSRVSLPNVDNLYPAQLSGGMKMRVSVARALVANPRLLFFDEPFSALDEVSRFDLQDEVRKLWQQLSMTVLFVTHSLSEAVYVSNRVIVLSGGRPSNLLADLQIQLPRDRSMDLRLSDEFARELKRVHSIRGTR